MTTVLRHCWPPLPLLLSAWTRSSTADFTSSSSNLIGASTVLASSLPDGSSGAGSGLGAAPLPCQRPWTSTPSLLRTVVLAPLASAATIEAVFALAEPLFPPTSGREIFHFP